MQDVLVLPTAPREEGWTVEPCADLRVVETKLLKHFVLHLLLARHSEEKIDAGEGHPI